MEFTGSTANTYSGTTTIADGTLRLNKDAGVLAIQGTIVVGDGLGGDDADQLVHASTGQVQLLAGNRTFTINSSGRWETNGDSLSITNESSSRNLLLINSGAQYSGDLDLGGGTLTLERSTANGSLINNSVNFGVTTTNTPAATISDGTIVELGTNQIITVSDSGGMHDLEISAQLSGDFRKDGAGGLALLANNNLLSSLRHNGGLLIVGDDGALGTGLIDVSTTSALIQGNDDNTLRTIANDFQFSGSSTTFTIGGFQGISPLAFTGDFSATTTGNRTFVFQNSDTALQGNLDFNGATTVTFNTAGSVGTPAGNLTTISGDLSSFTTFTKTGRGILVMQGTSDNTGVSNVSQGILRLQNAGGLGSLRGFCQSHGHCLECLA